MRESAQGGSRGVRESKAPQYLVGLQREFGDRRMLWHNELLFCESFCGEAEFSDWSHELY